MKRFDDSQMPKRKIPCGTCGGVAQHWALIMGSRPSPNQYFCESCETMDTVANHFIRRSERMERAALALWCAKLDRGGCGAGDHQEITLKEAAMFVGAVDAWVQGEARRWREEREKEIEDWNKANSDADTGDKAD